ncbi:MAG: hypothetical protein WBA67_09915 [Jannaschia sp.]
MRTLGTPLALGRMGLGAGHASLLSGGIVAPPAPPLTPPPSALPAPQNLYSASQSSFADAGSWFDGRGDWSIQNGKLVKSGTGANDARLKFDAALTAGRAYYTLVDLDSGTAGNVKLQLASPGTGPSRNLLASWTNFQYSPRGEVGANFARLSINPTSDFNGSLDNVRVYDLSTVDPTVVPCDVIIIGGDSNSSSATSEFVTPANRETPFDPRIWFMPCLRTSPTYNEPGLTRHVPAPAIEPIVGAFGAKRMSPSHAAAAQLVDWSAARGRPLLIMALGEAGSGLRNTEDWVKGSTVNNTGARMWNEMMAMKAAVMALGPAHQIVGAIWSLGANDRFGGTQAGHEISIAPFYSQFFSNVRADVADVPMVLVNLGAHVKAGGGLEEADGRSESMRIMLRRFDQASGDPRSIPRFKVIEPPVGNQLVPGDDTDPHFNAVGIQANGRAAGAALRSLLTAG